MKIRRLELIAYGRFSNEVLDFESDALQIIYGPNEAGKSTALRALQAVLFGMTEKNDAFIHPWDLMRLGMSVEVGNEIVRVERRKGKGARSLVYAGTERAVTGEEWKRVLPVTDETLFMQMFALNYKRLVEGGRELAEGKGDIGQALLAAAGDLGNAVERLGAFQSRAGQLFQPHARSQSKLAVALREYKDADKRIRSEKFSSQSYRTAVVELEEKQREIRRLRQEVQTCAAEQAALGRLLQAAPAVALLLQKQAELDAMSGAPVLTADFASRHQETVKLFGKASTTAENGQTELKRLEEKLAEIKLLPVLAGLKVEIEKLLARSGKIEASRQDRPKRESELRVLRERASRNLRDLGLDIDPSCAAERRVNVVQRSDIKRLAGEYPKLATKLSETGRTIDKLKGSKKENRELLENLSAAQDTTELERCIAGLSDVPTERELTKMRSQVVSAEMQAESGLQGLPLFRGSAVELGAMRLPLPATLRDFQTRFAQLEISERQEKTDKAQAEADIAVLEDKIRQLENRGAVPTDADLESKRKSRELSWTTVKYRWLDGQISAIHVAELYPADLSNDALATAYEQTVEDTDAIADSLRSDAASVEQKALYLDQISRDRERVSQLEATAEKNAGARLTLGAEWTELWAPSSIDPRTPVEMLDWLDSRRQVVEQLQHASSQKRELTQSESHVDTWLVALKAALLAIGESDRGGTLDDMVRRARKIVQVATEVKTKKRDLEMDEHRLKTEQSNTERHLADLKREVADWEKLWAAAITGLPVKPEALPDAVLEVVRLLDEVTTDAEQMSGLVHRIETMERDEREFSSEVEKISAQACIKQDNSDAVVVVDHLNREASSAKRDVDAGTQLEQDIERTKIALGIAQLEVERQEKAIAALCTEASVNDSSLLRSAIDEATRKRELATQIADQKRALTGACAGGNLNELLEAVNGLNLDAVPGQLKDIEERQRHSEDQKEDYARRVIELERDFELHESAAALSQAAAEKQDAEARILNFAEQYLEQEIAARLISAAIERYRTNHQDPLLDRAGQYLKNLTCGSFSGLVVDFEDGNRRVLRALRHDSGQHVDITGMSDGARDQLFFALRLAYIEDYCVRIGPCPVILDDVLMAFDNDRAVAALRVLGELAKKTQVLLFTHHSHHRDLALLELEQGTVSVHDLTSITNAAPATA